jgi:hypothetical protein
VFRFTLDVRGDPFQYAVEVPADPEINPFPAMKTVNDWLPAVMLEGYSAVMTGVGFGGGTLVLFPQLDTATIIAPSTPSAVQRQRINPVLL